MRRIAELSGGNAFFAQELLAAQRIEGHRPAAVARARRRHAADRGAVWGAQQVVRCAAVAGRQMSHALLSAVSELSEPDLLDALRELVGSHVLLGQPDGSYRFRHALTQEAVYADLLPGERRARHAHRRHCPIWFAGARRRAALRGDGDDCPPLGRPPVNPEMALAAAVTAGRAAMDIQGFSEGLQHFRRALALWPDATGPPRRRDRPARAARRGRALRLSGRPGRRRGTAGRAGAPRAAGGRRRCGGRCCRRRSGRTCPGWTGCARWRRCTRPTGCWSAPTRPTSGRG